MRLRVAAATTPCTMSAVPTPKWPHSQRERLKRINVRPRFLGVVSRADQMAGLKVPSVVASRDLELHKEPPPFNAEFDQRSELHLLGQHFVPLFEVQANQPLSWLVEQVSDVVASTEEPLRPCSSPARLTTPRLDIIVTISRSIYLRQTLQIRYHSMSRGQSVIEIVPFALLDAGLGWHVWAFDRKAAESRDFALTRIQDAEVTADRLPMKLELPENDAHWTRMVDLQLIPNPDKPRPEVTRMDYGMDGGSLSLKVRAAIAGYFLRRWSVDCSPDHALNGPEHHLWLRDHLALYGVKSAAIAPGYQPSTSGARADG